MKHLPVPLGIALGFGLFAGFAWLSPQLYYTYYMTLFTGLPWQIVVKDVPTLQVLRDLLCFQGPSNMSAHSLGLLGWALMITAVVTRVRAVRAAPPDDHA